MRALACIAATFLLAACGPSYAHLVERDLAATESLTCPSYLVWENEPVRDVFLVINGSGVLSNAFVHGTFDRLMDAHGVAYLTYDKPGIRAPFGDPAEVRRDEALFRRYTLGHGVACATDAIHQARERFGASVRLHLRGHSEGSIVALYALDALLEQEPDTAASIATLVLSGVPLEPFDAIFDRQLGSMPNGAQLRDAIARCDWPAMRDGMGVSCAYIEDAVQRPSGRAMFERLAARASHPRIVVFQGTEDWHTPADPTRALEAWDAAEGHLGIEFHYYEGGHRGNEAGQAEMARVLGEIVGD